MSRRSVSDVLDAARAVGVGWDDVAGKTDGEVYALLVSRSGVSAKACTSSPTGPGFIASWRAWGVTLRILHGEYADGCRRTGKPHMGYDRFCKLYAAYVQKLGVTSRVEHKAGRTIEVDWAGKTLRIVDPVTGDSSTAYLFVAVLPFSRYAFVEPTLDMAQNSWLRAHVAMYEWFGGSTPRLVCDNLKTGVIAHPREGEVVLNDAYRGLARALLGRRAARTGQEAEGQALGGEHRMARHDGVGRRDARPPVRLVGRAADRDTRVARGIQFPPVPEA